MKRAIVVFPFLNSSHEVMMGRQFYGGLADIDLVGVDHGKELVGTYSDIEYQVPGILDRIAQSEKEGYGAAVIGCFGDPAIAAARQMVSIPVLGAGETSLAVASTLGQRFVLLEPSKDFVFPTEEMVAKYGYRDKVIGIYHLEIPLEACVKGFQGADGKMNDLSRSVAEEVCKRVAEAKAHVVILGCIGLAGFVDIVSRSLAGKGYACPIVEPGIVVMRYAKFLLESGLNQSREMWPRL